MPLKMQCISYSMLIRVEYLSSVFILSKDLHMKGKVLNRVKHVLTIFLVINRLCGSYESLKGGQTSEAMVDFTGGVNETFRLDKLSSNFFKLMLKAQARQSLMCCSINAKPNEIEAKLENGLIKGHAYTVTGVTKVPCFSNLI